MQERSIGEKIREHRLKKGMTQDTLAAELHVSSQAVSKWEKGQTMPDISLLLPLSRLLEIGVDDLLGGDRRAELERAFQRAIPLGEELTLLVSDEALKEFPDDETFLYRRACDEYHIAIRKEMSKAERLGYLSKAQIHFSTLHQRFPENEIYTSFLADVSFEMGEKEHALNLIYTIKDKARRDRTIVRYTGGDEEIRYKQSKLNQAVTGLCASLLESPTRESVHAAYALLDVMMKDGKNLRPNLVWNLYLTDARLCLQEGDIEGYVEKFTKSYETMKAYMDLPSEPISDPDPLFNRLQHTRENAAEQFRFLETVWDLEELGHPASLALRRRIADEHLTYHRLYRHEWLAYYQFCKRHICRVGYFDFSIAPWMTFEREQEGMRRMMDQHPGLAREALHEYYRQEVERLVGGGIMRGFVADAMNTIVGYCNCWDKEKYTRLPIPENYSPICEGARVFSVCEMLVAPNLDGCGVEEKLLETALAYAKEQGFTHAEAYLLERMVFPDDALNFDKLFSLYEKFGFAIAYDMTKNGKREYVLQKAL